jgi:hypothetical protein
MRLLVEIDRHGSLSAAVGGPSWRGCARTQPRRQRSPFGAAVRETDNYFKVLVSRCGSDLGWPVDCVTSLSEH